MGRSENPKRTGANMGTPELADLIKNARERKNMSQNELARQTGKTRGYMWQLETGRMAITTQETAEVFAEALGLTVDEIFAAGRYVDDSLYDLVANASPRKRQEVREVLGMGV